MNIFAFCRELEYHPNELHLIAGYTSSTAGSIIFKSDGFGIERYFAGRCSKGRYEDKPCYYIQTATGQKVIMRTGGNNILSQDAIAGYTFGTAYISEPNRCHPKFVEEVFSRTFSSARRKVFHDINPKAESDWYYADKNIGLSFHINAQANNPSYGFNYGHFTMADNLSMSDKQIREVIKSVPKGTVWYARDILGQRRQVEGLVYSLFNPKAGDGHVVPTVDRVYTKYQVSVDYGTRNRFVALLWGFCEGVWYCVKEFIYDGRENSQKNSESYRKDLEEFIGNRRIEKVIIDPSAQDFKIAIQRQWLTQLGDNAVDKGIRSVADAFYMGLIKINDCCIELIKGLGRYMWDEKKCEKSGEEVPIKNKDDEVDALRYFVYTNQLVKIHRMKMGVRL